MEAEWISFFKSTKIPDNFDKQLSRIKEFSSENAKKGLPICLLSVSGTVNVWNLFEYTIYELTSDLKTL